MTFKRVANSTFRIPDSRFGSTKTRNPESGNGNGIIETETKYGIRNTESNINDRKLKNFTFRNLVQSKENLFWYIFLLMCLDKVCRSVGYCTARPMKVILRLIFIHESIGSIIQLNIAFVAKCQE